MSPVSEPARVFITGNCQGLDELRHAIASHPEIEVVGWKEHVAEAAGVLAGGHLQAVLHAVTGPAFPSHELAAIREHTRAPVILLAAGDCARLLDQALEHDVADVLPLPQLPENVVFAILKARFAGRRMNTEVPRGRIITVFSPKGGTGKTVLATNLAACFAKHERKRTLLLDLDLQFGDASIMYGLEPEKTIYDLVVAPGELDSEKLAGYTTRHQIGLDLLPAPLRPEDAELVTETKLARLLEVARASYDVIVVDTSPFFHGPMLATIDRTDELVLVCGLEVPTLKNLKLALQTLELLSFPSNRIRILLNRANSKVGMSRKEVEAALELKVRFQAPSDRAVPLSVNRGAPAVLGEPQSDFSRAVAAIAKVLATPDASSQPRRRLFARARG